MKKKYLFVVALCLVLLASAVVLAVHHTNAATTGGGGGFNGGGNDFPPPPPNWGDDTNNSGAVSAWTQSYGTYADWVALSAKEDSSGNFYVEYQHTYVGSGLGTIEIIKYSNTGTPLWTQTYSDGNESLWAWNMDLDASGNAYAFGDECNGYNNGCPTHDDQGWSLVTIKFPSGGGSASAKYYVETTGNTPWYRDTRGVVDKSTGDPYIINTSPDVNAFVKYDSNGNQIWANGSPPCGGGTGWQLTDVESDTSGHLYAGCSGPSNNVLEEYDSNGNQVFQKAFTYGDAFLNVDPIGGHLYIVQAKLVDSTEWEYKDLVGEYDPSGNTIWQSQPYEDSDEFGYGLPVGVDSSGNVYVLGTTAYEGAFYTRVTKYNSSGAQVWNFVDSTTRTIGSTIMVDPGGTFTISSAYSNFTTENTLSQYNRVVGGGITVGSHNIVTNGPVTASWEFTSYPSEDPCSVGPCYEIPTGTYSGLPGGPYTMNPDPAPHGYSFRSIQEIPIAQTPKTKLDSLFALGQDLLFPIAHAVQEDPNYPWSQPLSPGGSDTMIILWDPQAALSVNPGSLSINQSNPSATLSLSNSGSPGSTSTWAATSDSNWLTVSPSAGTDLQTGNPVTLTVTATTTGLSAGTHIAHISFSGTSYPSGQNLSLIPGALPSPVTVTFTVNEVCGDGIIQPPEQCDNGPQNGICPATCSQTCQNQTCSPVPTCPIFNPVPPSIVIPDSSNLDYRCINVSACSLSGGQFNGLPLPLTGTSTIAGTQVATPATTTVYTITCQGIPPPPPGDPNYTIHATVNVSVNAAGRCETNPGGVGCSNQ